MRLTYTIAADAQQAERANAAVEAGLQRVETQAKKAASAYEGLAPAEISKKLEERIKGIERAHADAAKAREAQWREEDKRLGAQTKKTGDLEGQVRSLGKAMLAAFAIDFSIGFVRSLGKAAGEIRDTSAALGLSTKTFQTFKFAVEDGGGTVTDLSSALAQMSKNLINGPTSTVNALRALNLDATELKRLSMDQAFLKIADAIRDNKNPMEQLQLSMAVFGRSGKDILPAIQQDFRKTAEEASKLGLVMKDETIDALDLFDKRWERTAQAFKVAIGGMLGAVFGLVDAVRGAWNSVGDAMPAWLQQAVRGGADRTLASTPVGLAGLLIEHGVGGTRDRVWNQAMYGDPMAGPGPVGAPGSPGTFGAGTGFDTGRYSNLAMPDEAVVIPRVTSATKNLTSARRELERATRDATAADEKYLRGLVTAIGVNQQLKDTTSSFAQTGIAGAITGININPNIPSTNPLMMTGLTPAMTPSGTWAGWSWAGQGGGGTPAGPGWGNAWDSNAGTIANGAFMGMQVANGVQQFRADTDVAGRGNRAWAGAQTGAQIGAVAGPWGALIGMGVGALVGALRNPGFEQEMKRIAKDFGVDISEELARSIDHLREELFGGDRQAAEIYSLGSIIEEAGGITDENVDRLMYRLRDVFVMVETGRFSAEQARKVLDESFVYFAQHLAESGELASRQFLELIELNARFGTESAEIAAWVGEQANSAVEGLRAYLMNATVASQTAATGITAAIAGLFGELRKQGKSTGEILAEIGPMIIALTKQLKDAGLEGGEAFKYIGDLAKYAGQEIVQKAVAATDGLTQAMRGLHNGGLLNQETFSGLARAVYDVYHNLWLQGQGGEMAWRMMQPGLQTVWELQRKFGYEVDEATQALLDQAEAAGIIGDAFRPSGEIMAGLLTDIRDILGDIRDAFRGVGDEAEDAAQRAGDAWRDAMPGAGPSTDPDPGQGGNGGDYYGAHMGGVVPQYLARGGVAGLFQPRYTDTVPAMLTPGEGVLSRRGMQMLGRLNGGMGSSGMDAQAIGRAMAHELARSGGLRPVVQMDTRIVTEEIAGRLGDALEYQGIQGPAWRR